MQSTREVVANDSPLMTRMLTPKEKEILNKVFDHVDRTNKHRGQVWFICIAMAAYEYFIKHDYIAAACWLTACWLFAEKIARESAKRRDLKPEIAKAAFDRLIKQRSLGGKLGDSMISATATLCTQLSHTLTLFANSANDRINMDGDLACMTNKRYGRNTPYISREDGDHVRINFS